jgi:pyruvate-ferredoxin/flavodoxin oxidoreductase
MLRSIAGEEKTPTPDENVESKVRQEMVSKLASGLMQLVTGEQGPAPTVAALTGGSGGSNGQAPGGANGHAAGGANGHAAGGQAEASASTSNGGGEYMAPWIDSSECTSCDECININPKMFKYDDKKKAFIADPFAGTYKDLVKAAEKCTAQVIHPGLPKDRSEKDIDKWIARGQ